jgi:hypothetical protein
MPDYEPQEVLVAHMYCRRQVARIDFRLPTVHGSFPTMHITSFGNRGGAPDQTPETLQEILEEVSRSYVTTRTAEHLWGRRIAVRVQEGTVPLVYEAYITTEEIEFN